jgi:pimeloyl-ACP methyl ester carboxylesterase
MIIATFLCLPFITLPLLAISRPGFSSRPNSEQQQQSFTMEKHQALAPCPNNSGLFDSVTVPVGQSTTLYVFGGQAAPPGGAIYQLSSDDPSILAAGDLQQAFLPQVFIPEGEFYSGPFTLFGIAVGQTTLRGTSLTPGMSSFATPAGAWDIGQVGQSPSAEKFFDANPPWNTCRTNGTAAISADPDVLSTCGSPVAGVATDGVTQILLRSIAGLPGTACYEVTSTSSLDQGMVEQSVLGTQQVGDLQEAFSFYQAPASYGDSSNSRTATLTFTYTPSIGNGNTTSFTADLSILRPPVMLLHGLWSSPGTWPSTFNKNDAFHTTFAGDYSSTAASSYSVNEPQVQGFVAAALDQFRANGNAATQVDVIAHSMGGILTRLYADGNQFFRTDNYNQGDVRRLMTLDTPHWGSSLANLLVSLHQVRSAAIYWAARAAGDITQGAVCDLAENSPALTGLTSTEILSRAVTGEGGPFPSYLVGLEQLLTTNVCLGVSTAGFCIGARVFVFPQDRVNGFRFNDKNDAIVGLLSQQGGETSGPTYNLLHFGPYVSVFGFGFGGIVNSPTVASDVFSLLDEPAGSFENGFPAALATGLGNPRSVAGLNATTDASDYTAQCTPGGPMKPAAAAHIKREQDGDEQQVQRPRATLQAAPPVDPRVRITSPTAGQVYAPGATLNINVQVDASANVGDVLLTLVGIGEIATTSLGPTQFHGTQVIPATFSGPLTIVPVAVDNNQNYFAGAPVTVSVRTPIAPQLVVFAQKYFYVSPTKVPAQQLHLTGFYSGGTQLDLTSSVTGTTYTSNNTAAVTVTADGLAQLVAPGLAIITGANGGVKDFAIFVVQEPGTPLPPQDVSANFTLQQSGFALNRNTGFFVQSITITNQSGIPIPGPLYLVLSGLPTGVELVNKSGITQKVAPGSSFIKLPLSSDGRTDAPGQSNTLTLQFLDPSRIAITYSASISRSSTAP